LNQPPEKQILGTKRRPRRAGQFADGLFAAGKESAMKILIVYDSVFGNTERVAQAMGSALCDADPLAAVEVVRVGDVTPQHLRGVDLLLVGSPTRAFRPTPATSAFLKGLSPGVLKGAQVAAFDTRINPQDTKSGFLRFMVSLFGYAAPSIAKQMAKKGAHLAAPAEGFEVRDTEGPLKDGELERAGVWVKALN
jgi:flavodoxin I